jgi:hypothetical protein
MTNEGLGSERYLAHRRQRWEVATGRLDDLPALLGPKYFRPCDVSVHAANILWQSYGPLSLCRCGNDEVEADWAACWTGPIAVVRCASCGYLRAWTVSYALCDRRAPREGD